MHLPSTPFARQIALTLAVMAAMVCSFVVYVAAEKTIDMANDRRLQSLRLVDELRQSSNDLTRMARLFVATGEPRYARHFQQILDIRDGRAPKPDGYDNVYWDLVMADVAEPPPLAQGSGVALLARMKAAGFTDDEFAVLARSKDLSDQLTRTEREAMRLSQVSGDGAEAAYRQARALLLDADYLKARADIMRPIADFSRRMETRTTQAVADAERRALATRWVLLGFGLVLLFMVYRAARTFQAIMGGPVDQVHARITRLGTGDFSGTWPASAAQPGTVMARLADTQAKLQRLADERNAAQADMARSEAQLKEAQRLARVGSWEVTLATRQLVGSDETFHIFELDRARFDGTYDAFIAAVHPEDRDGVRKGFGEAMARRRPHASTFRLQMADGRIKYVHERCEMLLDDQGRALRAVGTVQDITESRLGKLALERANRDLRLLSDCNMALVQAEDEHRLLAEICRLCVVNGGYRMAWVGYADNDAAKTVRPIAQHGHEAGYLDQIDISWADSANGHGPTGTAIRTGLPSINQNVLTNPRMDAWRGSATQRGFQSSVALPLVCNGQTLGALNLYAAETDTFDPEELELLMELANDLAYGILTLRTRTEHAAAKERLEFLANFDALTNLPNRLLLRDRFEHAARIAETDGKTVSMLYIDLDRFQEINDSQGHAVADQVLVVVVERLRQAIPATATISRHSGDEFIVLLNGQHDIPAVIGLVTAIREALSEPIALDGGSLNVSCCIGIGFFPGDGEDFDTLHRHLRAAVDSAKEAGGDTYRFYSRDMKKGALEQIRLTGGLTSALQRGEFVLHYQPQVDIRSGRIVAAEALVRWNHPADGLIAPSHFIALAERSGHIVPLGEWVLNEACRQGRLWQDRLPIPPVVAVNLSSLHFKRGDVLAMVSSALANSGLKPHLLELELTESVLLQDFSATVNTLLALKAMGVLLSIDDFGTGYSSLSYLQQLAVDKLKIDQSFIPQDPSATGNAAIVRAVVQLGHNLNLQVIAEGVETPAQLAFLDEIGCDQAQGFLFSRPVSAEVFERLMEQEQRQRA